MSIIHNERTKYVANSFDRASTSCLTVGVFAPIAAAIYAPSVSTGNAFILSVVGPGWLFAAAILHSGGKRIVRKLL